MKEHQNDQLVSPAQEQSTEITDRNAATTESSTPPISPLSSYSKHNSILPPIELPPPNYLYSPPSTFCASGKWPSMTGAGKQRRPSTADEREHIRRLSHSAIEKRRRERINDKIEQLKRLIPSCTPPKDGPVLASMHQPIHKLSVLQAAIDYINQLHRRIEKTDPNNDNIDHKLVQVIYHARHISQTDAGEGQRD
ncbi:hypothetical protein DFQ28_002858 [Apophysomyces sp. BC1034]|nr:hypothetical protein DFQ28_002858 [Apophysomyces sp. BC1034]